MLLLRLPVAGLGGTSVLLPVSRTDRMTRREVALTAAVAPIFVVGWLSTYIALHA